jgi:hypothetical protein
MTLVFRQAFNASTQFPGPQTLNLPSFAKSTLLDNIGIAAVELLALALVTFVLRPVCGYGQTDTMLWLWGNVFYFAVTKKVMVWYDKKRCVLKAQFNPQAASKVPSARAVSCPNPPAGMRDDDESRIWGAAALAIKTLRSQLEEGFEDIFSKEYDAECGMLVGVSVSMAEGEGKGRR